VTATVLVVEDEPAIQELIAYTLKQAGHQPLRADTAEHAMRLVQSALPDLVLLDWMLPGLSGIELARRLRADKRTKAIPIIMLTARADEQEKITGLEAGADDYIIKPFSAAQVDARIRALLRRTADPEPAQVEVGELVIDAGARTATLAGETLELSRKEFDLLLYLARRVGKVVTKQELLAEIWAQPYGGVEKTVDTHLSWLRAKLGENASAPRYLHTVRGVGIKLLVPPTD
jgi:two-component system, OmpR family, KDP operon response regulator KdpE